MDILLGEVVPVFTNIKQYDILPTFIPWRKMSGLVPVETKERFFQGLASVNVSGVHEFNQKHNMSHRLDWRNIFLFEQYMAAFSSQQLKIRPTR